MPFSIAITDWDSYHLAFLGTFQDLDAGAKFQASLVVMVEVETLARYSANQTWEIAIKNESLWLEQTEKMGQSSMNQRV